MAKRKTWQAPKLVAYGSVADFTRGKAIHGNDAFCGSDTSTLPPPGLPSFHNDSSDAIVGRR